MKRKRTFLIPTKILAEAVIFFTVLLAAFFAGRYGWKLLGFPACESAGIERITVTNSQVEIVGFDPSAFPRGFIGYYAQERGGKLYVGFRFSSIFGFFETGDFDITIPTKGQIREIYIKTGQQEYLLWSNEEVIQ